MVYTCTYTYIQCTDTVSTCMYFVHNHTSFPIRPYQPCHAGESQLRAQPIPFKLHPSCHQSPQLTDHPGAACHVQIATATGSPHTHCCHTFHLHLQCHSCLQGSQNSCACCTCEEWLGLSYQPGTRGLGELCPPCWLQEPHKGKVLASIPTVFQVDILGNLLNAVRVSCANQDLYP